MSCNRDGPGKWGLWYLVANRPFAAARAAAGYACCSGCEAGFRNAKWWLGFAQARIKQLCAWSRLFAQLAIALLVVCLVRRLLLEASRRLPYCVGWRHAIAHVGS